MNAADTNIVVRILTRDDERQAAVADRFIEGGAWVSTLALAEALWVLRKVYGQGAHEIAAAAKMLLNHKDLTLEDPDAVEAALHLFRSRPVLRSSDCLILELAKKAGHLPLGTFDRDLGKVPGVQRL
jgi:predicted nucleic acid-binding protein